MQTTELAELFAQGSYSQVISLATSLGVSPKSDPNSSHILAASYFLIGEIDSAHTLLKELIPIFENNAPFLSLYAATCRRRGDLNLSKQLFIKALAIDADSKEIQNNYANLLIDLGCYDESRSILTNLLAKYKDYSDARLNLNRLDAISQQTPVPGHVNIAESPTFDDDPLLLAFAKDEVDYSFKRYANIDRTTNAKDFPAPDRDKVVNEQIELIQKSIVAGDNNLALKLCSQALSKSGVASSIYGYASDALLSSDSFTFSEILLLHSIVIGGPSFKSYVNLVSFACMRKDFALANHYLQKAREIDPSSPSIDSLSQQINKQQKEFNSPYSFLSQ